MNKLIIALCGLLALASCKAHKQLVADRAATTTTEQPTVSPAKTAAPAVNTKLVGIRAKQVTFNTFSGKAKAKLDIDGNTNDATLNVRIQRDKKIWVSVTAILGIEVGRALITPDSVLVINKLQGVYIKKPFSYLYQYGGKQVNFRTLQSILTGNAIPETLADNADIGTDNANTLLSGRLQDLLYKLVIGPDFKVSQTNLTNSLANMSLQVTNSAFIQADNRIIPSQIDIVSSAGNKKANISMHYNNAEFDKVLDYPFSIPDRFTPVD